MSVARGNTQRSPTVRVLGPFEVGLPAHARRVDGKLARVLAMLVAHVNEPVTVDRLCDAVWGDQRPDTYESGLRGHLTRARNLLASAQCEFSIDAQSWGDEPGYCLSINPEHVDHVRFSEYAIGSRTRSVTVPELEAVLRLWRGTPFSGLDLIDLQPIIVRLEDQRVALAEQLAMMYLHDGRTLDAISLLRPLHAECLDRESTCVCLARAFYGAGRQRDALTACRATAAHLRDAGLDPSTAVTEMERMILEHDEQLDSVKLAHPLGSPDSLLQHSFGPFVGRRDDLARLDDLLVKASEGHGTAVLISGKMGIGKTRLLAEAARHTSEAGMCCVHVATDPLAPTPFHFAATLMSRLQLDDRAAIAGPARAVSDAIEAHRSTEHRIQAQLALERALDVLVRGIAALATPVILFLDDMQWVDSASLSVIRYLTRSGGRNLGMVMGARHGEHAASWNEFVQLLPSSPIETIALRPLSEPDIVEWMTQVGLDVGVATSTVAATVHRQTAGVPFVVKGVLDDLASMTDPVDALERLRDGFVPEGLYDPLRARIERLDEHDAELLAVAAVLSRPTPQDVAVVCRSLFGPGDWTIDERRCLGLLRSDRSRPGDYTFEHEITRSMLQDLLNADERRFVHRAAAEISRRAGGSSSEAAFHLVEAIPLVAPSVALDAITNAAADAIDLFAYEEAAVLYNKALAIRRRYPLEPYESTEFELEIALARAMQNLGARESALSTFADALHRAAEESDWDVVTECALASADFGEVLDPEDPVRRLLMEAIDVLPREHAGRRSLAVEAIIKTTIVDGATDEVRALYDDELASIPDGDAAAPQRHRAWLHMNAGSPNALERRRVALGLRAESPEHTARDWLDATLFLLSAELELGNTTRAERVLDEYRYAANESGRPGVKWLAAVAEADIAQLRGSFDAARRHAESAFRFGIDLAVPDAPQSYAGHRLVTARLTGHMEPSLMRTAENQQRAATSSPVLLAAEALLLALASRPADGAAALGDALWAVERQPVLTLTPFSLGLCAEAWLLLDRPRHLGARLAGLVAPYSGTMWRMALVGASLGPVDRHLGALVAEGGDRKGGARLLEQATRLSRLGDAPVWELASAIELVHYRGDGRDVEELERLRRQPTTADAGAMIRRADELLAGA